MPQIRRKQSGRERSVFRTITLPLLILLAVEAALLASSLAVSGVVGRLDQNARDILDQQVENRKGYLENSMVADWSDLTGLAEQINASAQALLEEGAISLETLDKSSDACSPLLLQVVDDLISTLRAKRTTGIFVIFNTRDLSQSRQSGKYDNKTGIYIQDLDPNASPSARNADLLLERAPIPVVQALHISTDAGWQPMFSFAPTLENDDYDFFFQPFQMAYNAPEVESGDAQGYGYWAVTPFAADSGELTTVTYTLPLVLEDGTVYGVLGVDLLADYLATLMPYEELFDNGCGSYLLAVGEETESGQPLELSTVLRSGTSISDVEPGSQLTLEEFPGEGYGLSSNGRNYYASVEYFSLYNSNSVFESQRWALIGAVETGRLYAFSGQVIFLLALAILLMLLCGVIGSVIIGRRISRPIQRLSEEVDQAQRGKGGIPSLSVTGIQEIDQFSNAITALSRDVVDASTRFLRIMEMASVELGGFEIRSSDRQVFVTDNFFPLFELNNVDPAALTLEQFQQTIARLQRECTRIPNADGSTLYRVFLPKGGVRYVRVEVTKENGRHVGLAEDVTAATLERLRIEHERDYDLLTGLLNRRAFYRLAEGLFQQPEKLGCAALVMLDLDNLKSINDRFGHDWGDQYIRQAGQCFSSSVPAETLCARVSGDEFFLLLSGYDSCAEIRVILDRFSRGVRESTLLLPDGEPTSIRVSGGVAWYPDDSRDFKELMRLADFAMYQVKQTAKGRLADFDLGVYNRQSFRLQGSRELEQLLKEELATYHFQPIVDARSGCVTAYEALMRVSLPVLSSPEAVLKLAREEGRLHEIERLTWHKAAECYEKLLRRKQVEPNALLFVNSIASQYMNAEETEEFVRRYGELQPRMVVELTESEDMDPAATAAKRKTSGFSGMFALDDYGSGYNSEKNLLELAPKFIKVDISIIRGLDTDPDKQRIVANIVGYAHERDMLIVAEGLETVQETAKALELGVDLLQGYFLARPGAYPPPVSQAALRTIREFRKGS